MFNSKKRNFRKVLTCLIVISIVFTNIDITSLAYTNEDTKKDIVSDNNINLLVDELDDEVPAYGEKMSVDTVLPNGEKGKIEYWTEGSCLYVEGRGDFVETYSSPWKKYFDDENITCIKFSLKDFTYAIDLFNNMKYIKEIDFMDTDMSKVQDLTNMCFSMRSLEKINLAGMNFSNVKNMSSMFGNCESLKKIDFTGINTSQVEDMSSIFSGCTNLQEVIFSGIDTSKVKTMQDMFFNCKSLKKVDFTGIDTSQVEDMSSMFKYCESIKEIDISMLDFSNVKKLDYAFFWCKNLIILKHGLVNSSKLENMSHTFDYCYRLAFSYIDFSKWDTSNVTNMEYLFRDCSYLKESDLIGLKTQSVQNANHMFMDCDDLKSFDFSLFDFSKATNIECMFSGCDILEAVNCNDCNLSSVKKMTEMFFDCDELKTVSFKDSDFSSVQDTTNVFYKLSNLEEVDCSGANFSSATSAKSMIYSCGKLTKADFSGADFSSVTDVEGMFYECGNLKDVNFNGIITEHIKYISWMFYSCKSLETVDLSPLKTDTLESFEKVFAYCSNLKSANISSLIINDKVELFLNDKLLDFIVAPTEGEGTLILPKGDWYEPGSEEKITEYKISKNPVVLRKNAKGLNYEIFNITVKESPYGSVETSKKSVIAGNPVSVKINPKDGNKIKDVLVNSESIGIKDEFVIDSVTENTVIEVVYSLTERSVYAIAKEHGRISDAGIVSVKYYDNKTYSITPDEDYIIDKVYVDGEDIGAVSTYTFQNVTEDHIIEATFKRLKYTISFNGLGANVSPSSVKCEKMKPIGDVLPKPALMGMVFEGWYTKETGGDKVTSETVFTFEKDITLYAHWQNINIAKGQKFNVSEFFEGIDNICKYKVIKVDTGKATINKKGLLKAGKAGKVKVAPCIKEGKKIKVLEDKAIVINISNPTFINIRINCYVGESLSLSEYLINLPVNTNEVEYSIPASKKASALLDQSTGQIQLLKKGKINISVMIKNNQGYTSKVKAKLVVLEQ